MSETAPPAPAVSTPPEKVSAGKKVKKPAKVAAATKKKPAGPSVSELIVQAVSSSKERSGVSLAALKKALAAAGYDVEKNNSRIKLGLKSLVNKGTLVQTKGTGASGSFKLSKKVASVEAKPSAVKVAAKTKGTGAAKKPKKATGAAAAKKGDDVRASCLTLGMTVVLRCAWCPDWCPRPQGRPHTLTCIAITDQL
nr:histone H1.1-like [Vicugna pacos]